MSKHLPPKGDWLPNEPEKLANLIGYLEQRMQGAATADMAAYQEHLAAAQKKLGACQ